MSQLLLLANLVVVHSSLDGKERKEALNLAADIVFYGHGYKSVRGVNELRQTWSKQLGAVFESGADNHPLLVR